MAWSPLQPLSIDVVGIHPRWSRLLVVAIRLTARPPTRWRELFHETATDGADVLDPAPVIDDTGITITPADEGLERDVGVIEHRIRLTNARYALEQRLPRPPSRPDVRPFSTTTEMNETLSADIRDRIQAARRLAEGMSGVFQSSLWSQETTETDDATQGKKA